MFFQTRSVRPSRYRRRSDIARRISRWASAFLRDCLLSCNCLPQPTANSTLARPFLKYIRNGMSVKPRSVALPANLAIFFFVQQQHARPASVCDSSGALHRIFGYVAIDEPNLVLVYPGISLFQACQTFA